MPPAYLALLLTTTLLCSRDALCLPFPFGLFQIIFSYLTKRHFFKVYLPLCSPLDFSLVLKFTIFSRTLHYLGNLIITELIP